MGTEAQPPKGFGWRKLLVVSTIVFALPSILQGVFAFREMLVAGLVAIVGLILLRKSQVGVLSVPVGAAGVLAVVGVRFLVTYWESRVSPSSFIMVSGMIVGSVVSVIAAIASLGESKGRGASSPAKVLIIFLPLLIAGALFLTVTQTSAIESEAAEAGDLRVITREFAFRPDGLEAETGTISVHVTNDDPEYHTFTSDELGINLIVPPGKARRVTFTAAPGTYEFICRPHPGMTGELLVD